MPLPASLLHRIAILMGFGHNPTFLQLAASLVNPPFSTICAYYLFSDSLIFVSCRISTYYLRLKSALQTLF
jgi:hypothetical protein